MHHVAGGEHFARGPSALANGLTSKVRHRFVATKTVARLFVMGGGVIF